MLIIGIIVSEIYMWSCFFRYSKGKDWFLDIMLFLVIIGRDKWCVVMIKERV